MLKQHWWKMLSKRVCLEITDQWTSQSCYTVLIYKKWKHSCTWVSSKMPGPLISSGWKQHIYSAMQLHPESSMMLLKWKRYVLPTGVPLEPKQWNKNLEKTINLSTDVVFLIALANYASRLSTAVSVPNTELVFISFRFYIVPRVVMYYTKS